jgi:hypothetical protein
MFGYSMDSLPKISDYLINPQKYKYGLYYTSYDGNHNNFIDILDFLGSKNVLILCKDISTLPRYKDKLYTTNDTTEFINSICNIIDFYDPFAARHVMSRFYIECFLNDIDFYVLTRNRVPNLNSLTQFDHIQYELIEKHNKDLCIYKVQYIPKYFKTDTYSKYIEYCFETENFNNYGKIRYVEDLSNDYFNI